MKSGKTKTAAAILAGVASVGAGRDARGAIFSAIDLEQNIFYDQHGTGPQVATPVTDQTVPFNSTVSLNTGTGGVISATYNIYDNGQTAGITISETATITELGNTLGEATQANNYSPRVTTFEFAQPVICLLTVAGTGTAAEDLTISGHGTTFGYGSAGSSYYNSQSGMLSPDVVYQFDELASFSNSGPGTQPVDLSGNELITLIFTPVPEPACAILLPALVAVRRRPLRRPAVGIGIFPATQRPPRF